MTDSSDETLDDIRARLAAALPAQAAFDGWTKAALDAAADACCVPRPVAQLAFNGGASEMIDAWFASVDAAMAETLPAETLAAMKIRARIKALVEARLTVLAPHREALRRAISVLSLPGNVATALQLNWRAADTMWRAAGDTATDFNHYSKRAILGGVYGATILIFLNDESEDFADTRAFLDRRIEGIMRFEKIKAQAKQRRALLPDPLRFLGRLRYAD